MREDTGTTTLADAGAYEVLRGSEDPVRPSRSDLGVEAYHERIGQELRQKREDAARARGDYVPSVWTQQTRRSLSWALDNAKVPHAGVAIVRDGVFAVTGPDHAAIVAALVGFDGDTVDRADAVWVRSEDSRHDHPPFC